MSLRPRLAWRALAPARARGLARISCGRSRRRRLPSLAGTTSSLRSRSTRTFSRKRVGPRPFVQQNSSADQLDFFWRVGPLSYCICEIIILRKFRRNAARHQICQRFSRNNRSRSTIFREILPRGRPIGHVFVTFFLFFQGFLVHLPAVDSP